MSWAEIGHGLYQRPIGEGEKGMFAAAAAERPHAREYIKIHCFVEITATNTTRDVLSAFRDSWKALRLLKTPDIATMFKGQYNQYKVPTEQELEDWLNRTFEVAETGTDTADVVRTMQDRLEYLPVCYLVPQTASEEPFRGTIILFISHWRSEASGCYQMVGQLCDFATDLMSGSAVREVLAGHVPGSEVQLLVPALEEIVTSNRTSSPESVARIEAHFQNYYNHLPSIDIAMQNDVSTPYSNVLLQRHTYSNSATSAVVAACKEKGFTVTAAVHSAYIGAIREMIEPRKKDRSYASLMPAQVRPRLPANSPYRDQGCWNASQLMMLVVPAGLSFEERAQRLKQQYNIAASDQWWYEDALEVSRQTDLMPTKMPKDVVAMPFFTSLGVVDRTMLAIEHGSIRVEKVWGWADPMLPGCVLTMWTFGGRLNVQITWNATFHAESQIKQILDLIGQQMEKELNVSIGDAEITFVKY